MDARNANRLVAMVLVCGGVIAYQPGCDQAKTFLGEKIAGRLRQIDARLDALEQRTDSALDQISQLQKDTSDLKTSTAANRYETAWLDPSDKGYQRLDTTTGSFVVELEDVKPYADGCRVTLQVGNLSSVAYDGFEMHVKWGRRLDLEHYLQWSDSLREKNVSFTDTLLPGTWNPVVLKLSPAKVEEFGHMEISMETNQIRLLRRK